MKAMVMLIFAFFPAVAMAGNFRETINLNLPAADIKVLDIRCGAGKLTLRGVEGTDSIHVIAEIEAEAKDGEEFKLLAEKLVRLDLRRQHDRATLLSDIVIPPLMHIEARIHLKIQLPVKMNVRITDGSGIIDIADIMGQLYIDDDSGAIHVKNVFGKVRIRDGSGDISIEDVEGHLDIIDGSGQMVIERVSGDVTITDASGGIEINDIGGSVTVSDGSGSIDIYRVKKNVFIRESESGKLDIDGVQGKVIIRQEE
jgi:hypothetical protein